MANNFCIVDLLSLNLLNFRLIILYFGTPECTFLVNFFTGEQAPGPPSKNVNQHSYRATYATL